MSSLEARIVAFMDLGTNSLRLLLVRLQPHHASTILTELRQIVRLGDDAFATQHLQPEAMARTVAAVKAFAEVARAHGAEEIVAVGTAATREAANQAEFLARLRAEAQVEVRVIAGPEEARLIYLGVAHGVHVGDHQALFIDIGGGSTEVSIGSQHQHAYVGSVKLGAIRLAAHFLPKTPGPVPMRTYEAIQRHVRHHAVRTLHELRAYRPTLAFGSSGTIRNLADVASRHFATRPFQHDDVLTYAHLQHVVGMLAALPLAERRAVPGLNPERADIILAGAAILDAFMQELGFTEIRVSDHGLREGLLVDYLMRHDDAALMVGLSVRTRSVLQLGRACHFDEVHARTTARLALALFDSGRELGLHRLGAWERDLLEYTALLHHIGVFLTYTHYQEHAYYLIRHANLLGFDEQEIALMAATALYQRKAMPRKKDAAFAALESRAQEIVPILSVFLRLAKHLDRGHAGLVQHASLCALKGKKVALDIHAAHDCQVEVWEIHKRADVFRKVLGRELVTRVLPPLPASAAPVAAETPATPSAPAVDALPTTPPHRA